MKKFNFKLIAFFLATVGLLIFLHFFGVLRPLESGFQTIFNPLASFFQSGGASINLFFHDQIARGEFSEKIRDLEGHLQIAEAENASLKRLEEENSSLRQHLKFFSERKDSRYVMANVIASEAFSGVSENVGDILIDKGVKDGVYEGLVVLNGNGVVIGKIYQAGERTSRVVLTVSSRCRLAAGLQNKNHTVGLAEGNLGLTIAINFVPQAEEVKIGDNLVTSGLEPDIPAGLFIGKVSDVYRGSNEIWQKVTAEPAANLDNLIIVSVLLPR
ncbi:MAG: rod shape-determining protein MreC [Patescibacteria group bacterium]|jgi:rod shape-determining protein MreC